MSQSMKRENLAYLDAKESSNNLLNHRLSILRSFHKVPGNPNHNLLIITSTMIPILNYCASGLRLFKIPHGAHLWKSHFQNQLNVPICSMSNKPQKWVNFELYWCKNQVIKI